LALYFSSPHLVFDLFVALWTTPWVANIIAIASIAWLPCIRMILITDKVFAIYFMEIVPPSPGILLKRFFTNITASDSITINDLKN